MSGYEDLRAAYADVYPDFQRLAGCSYELLRDRLDKAGLRSIEVSSRAKEPESFVKKALRKGYADPMRAIGDKAGARLVLPFARDRDRVLAVCDEVLELSDPEDKVELLGADRMGYLGRHYSARVRSQVLDPGDKDLAGLSLELQVHTKAESAWATAAHDSLYKSAVEVPESVARRLTRLAALAEIFDDQVERFLVELHALPDFAVLESMLPALEALLLRFTNRTPDRGISALIIPPLAETYGMAAESIVPEVIEPYLDAHAEDLRDLYAQYESDLRANPLLYQPEGLLLLERLEADPYQLRGIWPGALDVTLLERLATIRGKRLS